MELTLLLNQADAARLHRLPVVKAARTGRSRGVAVHIVWYDTLERTLANAGLALAEHRAGWRLERHRPAANEPWPPATDHRLIQEANGLEALSQGLPNDQRLPEATTPVVAFDGRRTIFSLTIDGELVSMTLLDGVLRAVAAEHPATRLILVGPGAAVRTLVLSLSEMLTLTVPEQSLAAEGLTLADGTKAAPRRRGAPELASEGLSVEAAFHHIISHLTDVILHLAPSAAEAAKGSEYVHHMRVAVRRARSALALFAPRADSPGLTAATEGLKRLGQMLGPARDWDVFMTETAPPVEAAFPEQSGLRSLLRSGARRRLAARAALGAYLASAEFRLLTLELACLAASDPPPTDTEPLPLSQFAATVLRDRWRKLLNAGRGLEDLDDSGLHGLRLKAKRLRYVAEFFAPMFPGKPVSRFIHRLEVLQERMGLFNDTAAAETLLRDLNSNPGHAAGLILGFTAARGARVKPRIASSWARFRKRDPFWE